MNNLCEYTKNLTRKPATYTAMALLPLKKATKTFENQLF